VEGDVAVLIGLDLDMDWHWVCTHVAIFEVCEVEEGEG
jgi:hypothetical protein